MFPTDVYDDIPNLYHPRDKAGFRHLFASYPVKAYSCSLENGRVFSKSLHWNSKLDFHFDQIGRESYTYSRNLDIIPWTAVEKRLSNNMYGYKKNTDVRTYFVINRNMFLTKHMFTFGLFVVAPQTFHVFKTTTVPIALYVPTVPKALSTEGAFIANEQYFYKMYLLQPRQTYYIPENVKYIMVTQHKTFFSVHVTKHVPSGSQMYTVATHLKRPIEIEPVATSPTATTSTMSPTATTSTLSPTATISPTLSPTATTSTMSPEMTSQQSLVYVGYTCIVQPNYVEWGRSLLKKEYGDPKASFKNVDSSKFENHEPLDLSYKTVDWFAELVNDLRV